MILLMEIGFIISEMYRAQVPSTNQLPMSFKSIFLILFFACSGVTVFSQEVALSEDEVPPHIVARHYADHQGSLSVSWQQIEMEGANRFMAAYAEDKVRRETIYNKSGRPLFESTIHEGDLPVMLSYYIEDRFGKFRLVEFKSTKDLSNEIMRYTLVVKAKEYGELKLAFDNEMNPIESRAALVSYE
ncbi:MAG: hypothetical protein RIC30_05165 [Marinoscillum sp.]|uniref:hypothetical protein n=1 Tax=Marinoscillum sp. TaxID=2024838 RepID=UPI00330109C9